ncbi:MAG: GntR family transcriptional regulator [Desulfopila sp.]|jgi:DNA-binding GntR family transcriptional regulator|nr:GntR family transcriptional regulator [Desulfopila sp.]
MKNIGIEYENLDQKVYQIVKSMIENRQLLPGEKIPQEKLAGELGISRTPLISALKFLEHEKLVEVKPRRGFFVRLFSIEELISIFEIREVLEGLAARRAARSINEKQIQELRKIFADFTSAENLKDYHAYSKADRRFHNFITEIASREFLTTILQTFNIISLAYQYANSEGLIREPHDTIEDHLKIIDAICDHDPDSAEFLMREHLEKTITKLKTIVNQDQEQTKEVNV